MAKLAIYGTGGFGREILPLVRNHLIRNEAAGLPPTDLVFTDDAKSSGDVFGVPIVDFAELCPGDRFILAVGNGRVREVLDARCREAGLRPETVFAEYFREGDGVEIGDGGLFCDYTMVTTSARIGRHFQCNIYSYVAHDCVIGDYVTFAPKVCCNGNVDIEDFAYIGTGAVLRQGRPDKRLRIGRGAVVGMGAVVTKDVADGAVVVGNPAKPFPS